MDIWKNELRLALRRLARSPGYTTAAIATLALGIGAVSAVYSVAAAVLFEPLPYHRPEKLDLIRVSLGEARDLASVSAPELLDLRERSELYEGFAAFWSGTSLLMIEGEAHRMSVGWGTANLFAMLGVDPVLGRHFTEEDEDPNAPPVALLSYHLWQTRFGGDREILGRTVETGFKKPTVIGVLPRDFEVLVRKTTGFHQPPDYWVPNTFWEMRDAHWLRVIGRRKATTSLEQGRAEMRAIAASLAAEHSEYAATGLDFRPVPLHQDLVGKTRPALFALLATVAFLLLMAAVNVAGMSLARTGRRGGELAVRAALGAGRGQLARTVLMENTLLAVLGAALGLLLAHGGVRLLAFLRPAQLPRLDAITIDGGVLIVTVFVTVLTLFISALAAVLHASRPDLRTGQKSGGRALSGRWRERTLRAFVVTEVALSLFLLIGAGLMMRTFKALEQVDLGFVPERVHTFRLSLGRAYENGEKRRDFFERALQEVARLPGVETVGGVSLLPFTGGFLTGHYAWDAATEAAFGQHEAEYRYLWPGFLKTVRANLVAGRRLTPDDVRQERKVILVDERLAEIAWPGENPLGRRVKAGQGDPEWYRVVGVLKPLRQESLRGVERPQIYLPFASNNTLSVVVRAQGDAEILGPAIRDRIRELDPRVAIEDLRPLSAAVSDVMADTRLVLMLMGFFAVIGLVLAAVGLHAVVSIWVGERRASLGLRLAIGARQGDILALVMRHALLLTGGGLAAGLGASLVLTQSLQSLLFGVSASDPRTFLSLAALLATVALLAGLVPAWRASRVDPVEVLRAE